MKDIRFMAVILKLSEETANHPTYQDFSIKELKPYRVLTINLVFNTCTITVPYLRNRYADYRLDLNKDKVDLLQYTGLKDINGIEIFEGDIVIESLNSFYKKICVVKFGIYENYDAGEENISGSGFYLKFIKYVKPPAPKVVTGDFGLYMSSEYIEVIGNIYENPDLIP